MRQKFIAGNWKMFTNGATGVALCKGFLEHIVDLDKIRIAVCPPYPYLALIGGVLKGSPVALGAQNCSDRVEGAFTGEVSPRMLADVGCQYVILGHSERRQYFKEEDALINRKLHLALTESLQVILCIGETIDERKAEKTEKVLDTQLTAGLANVSADQLAKIVIAYEPVWAIGTGLNATPQQAQDAHAFIRRRVGQLASADAASKLIIQYGGSVKPDNAATLLRQTDVDGALVGGASLKAGDFLAIIKAGQ
jgi:triosephosphate isomerase (TIM)